jgi:hypothetical protein
MFDRLLVLSEFIDSDRLTRLKVFLRGYRGQSCQDEVDGSGFRTSNSKGNDHTDGQ